MNRRRRTVQQKLNYLNGSQLVTGKIDDALFRWVYEDPSEYVSQKMEEGVGNLTLIVMRHIQQQVRQMNGGELDGTDT